MLKYLFILFLTIFNGHAHAAVVCQIYPEQQWAKQALLKQVLLEEGYTISQLEAENNCYEMYGRNKHGKAVEIYFDMKNLAIIFAEIEK
ncbi:MAG: PepSY domain-containing protein [Sulfuritalea sp.]|nr:PepSY domain-containing protein [Sulfuritalea sp.]